INNEQKNILFEKIQLSISSRKPFSLLRIGDADSYGLNSGSVNPDVFKIDCEARERKWWGTNLDPEMNKRLKDLFSETVLNADIIGIPSVYRFVSDLSTSMTSFYEARNQRGSVAVLENLYELSSSGSISRDVCLTDNRCHYE